MKTVLVVDDSRFMRASLKNLLKKNGYEVVSEAENGEAAIEEYFKYKPDIVTMDITMPVMTGIEALRAIKSHDVQAKIVMVSSEAQKHYIKKAMMSGAKYFIIKPFKEEMVMKILRDI